MVTFEISLTNEQIENLFVTAMEGGANYWADFPPAPAGEGSPSQRLIRHVLGGGSILIEDAEPTGDTWRLTLDSIRAGMAKMSTESPEHFSAMLGDQWDACTADAWLQFCTIGKHVFA